jgi:fibronectin-binding autotransporter adhesin
MQIQANAKRCVTGRRARHGRRLCTLAAIALGGRFPATAARADNLTFLSNINAFNNGATDGSEADGSGTWDTVTANWYDNTSGAGPAVWPNDFVSIADFGDPANSSTPAFAQYTVAVQPAGVNAGGIEFSYNGFNISGGPINFGTTNAAITADNETITGLISSTLTGTGGITIGGGGVVLTGSNTFTGGLNISTGGTLIVSTINDVGTAGPLGMDTGALAAINFTANNATLSYTGGSVTTARGLNFGAGNNFLNLTNASAVVTFSGQISSGAVAANSFYKFGQGTVVFSSNTAVSLSTGQNAFIGNGGVVLTGSGSGALVAPHVDAGGNVSNGTLFIGNENYTPSPSDTVAFLNISGGSSYTVQHLDMGYGNSQGANNVAVLNLIGAGTTFTTKDSAGIGEGSTGFSNVGTGIINISSGASLISLNSDFRIAEVTGTVGTVNMTGTGSLMNISAGTLYVGSGTSSVGVYNQSAGTVITKYGVNVASSGGALGSYYLGNGSVGSATLATGNLVGGSGTSTVYFNGGVIQPSTFPGYAFTPFINGITNAEVMQGGAIISTLSNGYYYGLTVPQNFSSGVTGGPDGGLTVEGYSAGTVVLSGTSTYTGPTNVHTGAISIATIANGLAASPIGASSNASSNLLFTGGTLTYTGVTAITDRGLTFGTSNDYINVATAATSLTFGGAVAAGTLGNDSFYKIGPGTVGFSTNTAFTPSVGQSTYVADGGLVLNGSSGSGALAGSGSTLYIGPENINPSATDTGAFVTLSGGTYTAPRVFVGLSSSGTVSTVDTLNLIGGATLTTANNDGFGETGTGTTTLGIAVLNVSGGARFIHTASDLRFAEQAGTTATVNVSGPLTGGIFVNSGTLYLGNPGFVTFNQAGGTVATVGNLTFGNNGTSSGTGTYTLGNGSAGSAVLIVGGAITAQGSGATSTFNFSGGTLQSNSSSATFLNGLTAANVLAGGATINSSSNSPTIPQALLNGTGGTTDGGLTKLGTGSLTLTGANTYNGGNHVSSGVLDVENVGSLGTLTSVTNTVASGGILALGVGAASGVGGFTAANVDTVRGNTTFVTGSALGLNTNGGNFSYGSVVTGPQGFLKLGVNTLTLTGASTYTGVTNVANGILSVSSLQNGGVASNIGASSNASSNLIIGGTTDSITSAQLQYTGPTTTVDRGITFTGTGDSIFNVGNASTILTLNGQVLAGSTGQTALESMGTLVIANTVGTNTLGGTGGLYIADGGLVLNGTNLINGTLRVGNNGPASEFGNSSNAFLNISSGTTTDTGSFFMAENNGIGHVETINVQSGATLAIVGSGVFRTGYSSTANTSGPSLINISGGAHLIGGNTLTLAASVNTQNAIDTTVNVGDGSATAGVLTLPAIALGSGTATVNFNNGTLQANASNGTLLPTGVTVNILAGGLTLDSQAFTGVVINANLNNSVGSTAGVTKVGTGTFQLSGTNTYAGATTISAGTLLVNGSTPSTGTVLVQAAGSLGGSGSVGTVIVAGTLTPGANSTTTGTLTTGTETWNSSGGYAPKVAAGGASEDQLVMSGLTISSTSASPFTVTPAALNTSSPVTSAYIVLATDTNTSQVGVFANAIAAGSLTLSPANTVTFSSGGTPALAELDVSGTSEELILDTAAAPEPTSLLLAGAAAAPLALGRRRRRARGRASA